VFEATSPEANTNPVKQLPRREGEAIEAEAAAVVEAGSQRVEPELTKGGKMLLDLHIPDLRTTPIVQRGCQQRTRRMMPFPAGVTGTKEHHSALLRAHVHANFVKDVGGTGKDHIGMTDLDAKPPLIPSTSKMGTSTKNIPIS
jgi:hypothetical protein